MYLKKLEIYGFKSFADKVNFEFKDGITAIVGPNGSGKSNVSDAIKWVLGEQKVKSLRGSKMEDVIFSGTQARKSLGYAQVTLTIDNEYGVFPIEFSEISVTRRLYRSGESEYFINKSICRLKDVQELFADTGLGKEGYSIIGQGKIDHIVSSNSQERRLLLEEAAGIVKYKNRKLESERKLERTQENLFRITDIIAELEKQLPYLEKQAKKAMSFLDLREGLKKVELNLFLHKVDSFKEELNKLNQIEGELRQNVQEKAEELRTHDAKYQELRKEIQRIDSEIEGHNQKLFELSEGYEKNSTKIQVTKTKIENFKLNIESIEKSIEEIEFANIDLSNKIEELSKRIEEVSEKLTIKKEDLLSLKEKRSQREGLQISSIEQENIRKKEHERVKEELNRYTSQVKILESKRTYDNDTIAKLLHSLEDEKANLTKHEEVKEEFEKEKIDTQKQILDLDKSIRKIGLNLTEKQKAFDKKNKEYKVIENNYNMALSKYKLMKNNEGVRGFHNSIKELLKEKERNERLKKNLHDIVGNLLESPKKYALAIETALGNSVFSLVTEDEDTAHECIQTLNRYQWGRATFLPLNIIKGQLIAINPSISAQKGYVDIACNLISFQPKYSGIFYNLLGKVIIVEDMNSAKTISKMTQYKYKIVTLGGEVFYPGGAIVGGKLTSQKTSIIQRKQELLELSTSIYDLNEEITKLKDQITTIEHSISQENANLIKANKSKNQLTTEEKLLQQKISQIILTIDKSLQTINTLEKQVQDIQDKQESENREVKMVNSKIQALMVKQKDFDRIIFHEEDLELKNEIKDLDQKIMDLNLAIAKEEEKLLYLNEQLITQTQSLDTNKEKLLTTKAEGLKIQEESKTLEEAVDNTEKLSSEFEGEKKQLTQDRERLMSQKEDLNKQIDSIQEYIKDLNSQNIIANDALNKTENKINSKNAELDSLQHSIFENYQMNYILASDYRYHIDNMGAEVKKMKEYKESIKKLGDVNIGSMEQYKEIKERYEFLSFQRDDLVKAKDALNLIITEISSNMENQFIEQFDLIEKEFSNTFRKLFDGGEAHLVIEEPTNMMETGIEIEVQPPGKRLKNITLLSGGEKALTAIALLFAIINVKPTPFCVLDEIDAALDDSNIERFSKYLHKISKENQFITITHRKGTMEIADRLYGISMGKDGVSKVVSVEISQLTR